MPEARAFVSALDEARKVGDDEAALGVELADSQVGVAGGEGIVGDLGPRAGKRAQERGLARVGQPHQSDVRSFS